MTKTEQHISNTMDTIKQFDIAIQNAKSKEDKVNMIEEKRSYLNELLGKELEFLSSRIDKEEEITNKLVNECQAQIEYLEKKIKYYEDIVARQDKMIANQDAIIAKQSEILDRLTNVK